MRGLVEDILPYAQEALAIARGLEDDFVIGMALCLLGQDLVQREGDSDTARTYLEESLTRLRSAGNDWFAGIAILGLGSLAFSRGDYEASRARIQESRAIFQEMGDRHFVNMARSALADLARSQKDFPQAIQLYGETIAEWRQMGNQGAVARCLECLALIAGEQAKGNAPAERDSLFHRAGILFGAAEAIRISNKSPMTPDEQMEYDQQLSAIRRDVEERDFQSAWSQGRLMSIAQAITYVREGRDT
jgi:tetratricopeptide (TPR) repeat protein